MINVHLIASKSNVVENIDSLRNIVKIVTDQGHGIVLNWVEGAHEARKESNGPSETWSAIYQSNLEAIAKADVIIADTTYNSFGVGYQVAVAVHQKKPILLLRHEDAAADAFATGVADSWVRRADYNSSTLEAAVKDFLDENDISTKDMRFNFFIDRQIYNYLRWSAFKTGKTKAEILRDLVQQEIEKKES